MADEVGSLPLTDIEPRHQGEQNDESQESCDRRCGAVDNRPQEQ